MIHASFSTIKHSGDATNFTLGGVRDRPDAIRSDIAVTTLRCWGSAGTNLRLRPPRISDQAQTIEDVTIFKRFRIGWQYKSIFKLSFSGCLELIHCIAALLELESVILQQHIIRT